MRSSVFVILFVFISISIFAQKNVVVSIGNNHFTKDEFELIYKKNNAQLTDQNEIKTPEEYVDLFIDYKLKVIEAQSRGMDTSKEFKDELQGYRDELAKPYLTDVTISDSMTRLAYYRSINEIRASHILLNLAPDAAPEDTLLVYNKIMDIREQFISGQKSFEELAVEHSDDPSAQNNKGDLKYFKAFSMITPFEDAAYKTPVGKVSLPVRTQHGYHIIYVTDLKKSEGDVKVAHIMKIFANSQNVSPEEDQLYKTKIDSIYQLIEDGADFIEALRKYTDDRSSVRNNGELGWINRTFGVDEILDAAYKMQIGEVLKPIRTPYGWHILKLIDKRGIRSFEEMENELSLKIKRDPKRSEHSKQSFYNKKKAEYNFKKYDENINRFKSYLNNAGDTLEFPINPAIASLPLYKVADTEYTANDFMESEYTKNKNDKSFILSVVLENVDKYEFEVIDRYEDSMLEEKHPEFNQILNEYHDGILLFSIMQDEVWNKAAIDTIGLEKHYQKIKNAFRWDTHFDGMLFSAATAQIADSCKTLIASGIVNADTLKAIFNVETNTNLFIKEGKWEKGDNERVDYFKFGGIIPQRFNAELEFEHGEIIEAGTPKKLNEARGLYISEYQKVLEDEWIKSLRKKYKIKVNKKLLKTVENVSF